jgi:hypothetical protein
MTNQEIAEKWANQWYTKLHDEGATITKLLHSAITEATKQQSERITELEAALKRNVSRAEEVHDLDMVEIGKQKKRTKEAITEATWDITRKYNIACRAIDAIYDENEKYEALARQFYGETDMIAPGKDVAAGSYQPSFEIRAEAWDKWIKNRPTSEQDGSKKTTTKDKEI